MHWSKAVALAVASAWWVLPGSAASQTLTAEHRCRLSAESTPAVFAYCATLTVPENPDEPAGPSVDLFMARIPSSSATPRPDPLVLINGGPGQSAVDLYLQARGAFDPARRDRDLILLDQRGTGRSAQGFACQVPEDLAIETAGTEALERFVDECLASLEHDPRFYTTSVAVQDLDRLRTSLGVAQWNLYGVSYGTRVAQHYLRRFPEHTRAVVLDGVVPPDLALGPDVAREAQRALDRIFERCATDGGCSEHFPDLPQRFDALLARLAAEPLRNVPGVPAPQPAADGSPRPAFEFGAVHLRALVRFMSYNALTVALLPVLISEAHDGNVTPLVGQARTTLRGLPESMSFPMSNAVVCSEDVPFIAPDATEGLAELYLGTMIVDGLRAICARWPAGSVDPDFKALVVSERPVLLLSGSNDPITPPAYAERVRAGGLSNSAHLIGRDQGHGMAPIGCVPRLLRDFLENPQPRELDGSCLGAEPPMPFFLTLLGPAP
jgi:pimeloyl-ACP methyl ester carboxylesterase